MAKVLKLTRPEKAIIQMGDGQEYELHRFTPGDILSIAREVLNVLSAKEAIEFMRLAEQYDSGDLKDQIVSLIASSEELVKLIFEISVPEYKNMYKELEMKSTAQLVTFIINENDVVGIINDFSDAVGGLTNILSEAKTTQEGTEKS